MTKKILLTAVAAAAMLATPAFAGSLSARAGGVAITASTPYTLARELNYATGITSTAGQFDTLFRANAALGAGTYTVNLAYAGAAINAGVSATAVTQAATCADGQAAGFTESTGAGATLTLTSGGSVGSNTLVYTLQVPQGATVTEMCFAPALRVSGAMSVTASITNQVTGQPVDPSVIQPLITTTTQGFAARAFADTTPTRILAGAAPRFRTLSADTNLGTISYVAANAPGVISGFLGATGTSAAAYKDLNGTLVSTADYVSSNLTINGNLTGLTLNVGGYTVTQSGNSATAASTTTPPANGAVVSVTVNGGANAPALQPSQFNVGGSFALGSAFAGPVALSTTALESISTEGASYIIPWVASATQGASTGSRTVVRVSRFGAGAPTGGSTGNIYAQIQNPIRGTATNGAYALVGTLGASGEVQISSQTFQDAFGDFGRADFRLIYTPSTGTGFTGNAPSASSNIIVKRVIAQPNGGVAEMDVVRVDGAVESTVPLTDQTPPVVP